MSLNYILVSSGRTMKWDTFTIKYQIHGIWKIPCQFDLRKYPFSEQTCKITWNGDTTGQGLNYQRLPTDNDKITYFGNENLGEFYYKTFYAESILLNKSISLHLVVSPYYGYHLLSSFFTGLLIVLISFITYLFPVDFFNERIMVSLTALLVLTGLFTQAASASISTPYLKLVDIWYALLISFTFLNVVINTGIYVVVHKGKSQASDKIEDEKESLLNKAKRLNRISFGIISFIFNLAFILFVLFALDII